jgi:hypothetical protein
MLSLAAWLSLPRFSFTENLYKSLTCLQEYGRATRCFECIRSSTEIVTRPGSDVHLSINQATTLAVRLPNHLHVALAH